MERRGIHSISTDAKMAPITIFFVMVVIMTNAANQSDACLTVIGRGVRKYTQLARAFQVRFSVLAVF